MKIWNKNICLTNRLCILVIAGAFFSTLVLASVWPEEIEEIEEIKETTENEMWIPTAEDIAYQDSMYTIIQNTQNDITDIKEDIVLIIERLDYADGTYDSIRYVKGGKIDKRRNH
jgi:sensor histidine kinase regulating citrate/malate metabolism